MNTELRLNRFIHFVIDTEYSFVKHQYGIEICHWKHSETLNAWLEISLTFWT